MSYQITLTNGNILTTVPDTQLVSTFGGLDLIGKNYAGFGTAFNNDLVHMVEHFADSTPPTNPFIGQIWYDTVSNAINFWNGTQFKPISVITSSPTAPLDPQEGDEWYDSVNQQLNIWNGFEWVLIGPPNQGGAKEGFVVQSIPTNTGNIFYLELYANNNLLGIVSGVNLTNPDLVGFGNIRTGWNFVTNPESAPSILESGIYNVSQITIGNDDQLGFITDGYDNGIVQVNGGNVMVAVNGNSAANTAAYTQLTNGNIVGTVYFDHIIAGSYGNLPAAAVPGSPSQVIYNNSGALDGSNALTILPSNVTARLDHLKVSAEAVIGTTLQAGGTTVTGLQVNGDAHTTGNNSSHIVYADIYQNLPAFAVPGVGGEVVYNNGSGGAAASPDLTVEGSIIGVTQLNVNSSASVATSLSAGSLSTTTTASIGTNALIGGTLKVDGQTTFNNGTGGQFTIPTDHGSVAGAPLCTDAIGGSFWGSINLALWTNSLTSSGYQKFPGGLVLQWKQDNPGAGSNGSILGVTFPISFPTGCLWAGVLAGGNGADLGATLCPAVISFTSSGLNYWWQRNADHGGNTPFFMIFAIGH